MRDQAERLRELVNIKTYNNRDKKKDNIKRHTRVISITSGKGGVGKTNIAINLAISLTKLGHKVIVFDADIGFANVDVILGIIPKYTIADVLNGDKDIYDIIEYGPNDIGIIAGGSGIKDIMNLSEVQLTKLTNQLISLENLADFIIIDTGAGLSNTVMSFVNSSDEVILIITPEPTSLTDGYAMIKTLANKNKDLNIKVIINRVAHEKEGKIVYNKLNMVANKFLKINVDNIGYINDSKFVSEAVRNQEPFSLKYPKSIPSKKMKYIAMNIIENKYGSADDRGMVKFVDKLKNFFLRG
ncbi:MinD/ParA family protein [Clostridiisalibacter paucivorans]|uniref:MinD/ParA family protein n=1 Tax=Clostridiisalibacter paucivorans TaxID=408753 RepID=UPI00047CC192|nr:MinD/ParA family protein [Clostridiisalibacter paucivorans]